MTYSPLLVATAAGLAAATAVLLSRTGTTLDQKQTKKHAKTTISIKSKKGSLRLVGLEWCGRDIQAYLWVVSSLAL